MAILKKKNSAVKKSETPAKKKEEGSALRNNGETSNKERNKDEAHNKGGHLKNNKGTGKGFDGPNYYESEQPSADIKKEKKNKK
ncbi:MAG: hypothetical protein ABIP51_03050 [Bacteroidia bacterium]